jgi:hypothetical protein
MAFAEALIRDGHTVALEYRTRVPAHQVHQVGFRFRAATDARCGRTR